MFSPKDTILKTSVFYPLQENANSPRQYSKSSSKIINVGNNAPQCTDVFNVYLKVSITTFQFTLFKMFQGFKC